MSTITVRYRNELLTKLPQTEVTANLIKTTAELFNKKPEEIIVEYLPWNTAVNVPDILIRAETSMGRKDLLDKWGQSLKGIFDNLNLRDVSVAVKTFAIESVWTD